MIGSMEAFIFAVGVILFITIFGLSTINHKKQSKPNSITDDQFFQMKLTLYGIHFAGIIAIGATILAVGATLWVTSLSMIGSVPNSGSNYTVQVQILNAMLQLSSLFSISGLILIVLGFVIPWYRLTRKKIPF